MKKNESQKPISLEELLKGLREQNEYQAKIISRKKPSAFKTSRTRNWKKC
ncbi:hypothetical protein [Hungatella hathewayi]